MTSFLRVLLARWKTFSSFFFSLYSSVPLKLLCVCVYFGDTRLLHFQQCHLTSSLLIRCKWRKTAAGKESSWSNGRKDRREKKKIVTLWTWYSLFFLFLFFKLDKFLPHNGISSSSTLLHPSHMHNTNLWTISGPFPLWLVLYSPKYICYIIYIFYIYHLYSLCLIYKYIYIYFTFIYILLKSYSKSI